MRTLVRGTIRLALSVSLVAAAPALPAALAAQGAPGAPSAQPPRVLPAAVQIASAVMPAPAELRAGAAVLGYAADRPGLVELRKGTNDLVCLASDPARARFHVACYHKALEPFMARGRELRGGGMAPPAADSVRSAEAVSGKLAMPKQPAALYSLTGEVGALDPATGAVSGARPLYVVYIPFATAESTGLSAAPASGTPWIMFPGTPKAHIMFVPEMR